VAISHLVGSRLGHFEVQFTVAIRNVDCSWLGDFEGKFTTVVISNVVGSRLGHFEGEFAVAISNVVSSRLCHV